MLLYPVIYRWFFLMILSTFYPLSTTLPPGITIDIDKGIIFDQLRYYSEKLQQQVFHIFIPFNNLCLETPNSDMCEYTKSINGDIQEIETFTSDIAYMHSTYDRKSIAQIIRKDLRRVFHQHEVEKFLSVTKSMMYYINDHFYLPSPSNNTPATTAHSLSDHDEQTIESRSIHPHSLVLEQITSKKIGYNFLNDRQIAEIVPLIISSSSQLIDTVNDKEYGNSFIDMIIGQSIFVIKSCSTHDRKNMRIISSCLSISTLFQNLPLESSSIYKIYQAIPLPVSIEGFQYVYENVPYLFGYNLINRNVLIWNREEIQSTCLLCRIVQCPFHPITVELSSLPCLAELVNTESSSFTQCQVSKSNEFQTGLLNVVSGLWYFYSSEEPFLCQINIPTATVMDAILIRPPMLVTFPCNQQIQCSGVKLPTTGCINHSIYVKTESNLTFNEKSFISLSLTNLTNRLLSLHNMVSRRSLIRLETDISNSKAMIDKYLDDFIAGIISIVSLFLLSISLIVVRYIKQKTIAKLDKLQTEMNRLQRDCILSV